jgi:glycosyltransferase involved in cell wall biosynthesis
VTYSLKAAGIETFVVNVHKMINREEFQFDYVSYFPPEKEEFYDSDVKKLGGKIYKLGYQKRGRILPNIKARINLYRCIKQNRYEIVHIHGSSGFAILEVLAARAAGCGHIIIHSHNSNISKQAKFGNAIRLLTKICRPLWKYLCKELLACSTEAAKWLYGATAEVLLIPNGVDTERFCVRQEDGSRWRSAHNIDGKGLLIGQIARFTVVKNHAFSLQIFREIHKEDPAAKLVFVGEGPMRGAIEAMAKEMGIYENILFYGVTSEVELIMNACDVLLLPSLYEGLPVVCVEAQYCGVPVIVSDAVTRDVNISDNIHYIPLGNSGEWKSLIMELKRKSHKCSIRDDRFDIRNIVGVLGGLYDV